jgi:hypothetical protein
MTLLTLADLHQIHQNQTPLSRSCTHESEYVISSTDLANFQLLMKQLFLGLPVQSLLDAYPLMAQWVAEVQELAPELFKGSKKLWVDAPIITPLTTGDTSIFIQAHINYGLRQGIPRLYEWTMRPTEITWQDAVKLWMVSVHYTIPPKQLSLIVLALHPSCAAQKVRLQWDEIQQNQTQQWLIQLLTQPTAPQAPQVQDNTEYSVLLNLDTIPEVPL